ncbi:hypothetical protein GGI12_006361, partial [Dipsacomyces acuminosporus]
MDALNKDNATGREQADETEPYMLKTLALGLLLDQQAAATKTTATPRRQSLSQRLGFQKSSNKGKDADTGSETESQNQEEQEQQTEAATTVERDKDKGKDKDRDETTTEEAQKAKSQTAAAGQATKQKPVKIECVELAGGALYVGTNDGHLVRYALVIPDIESTQVPEYFKVQSVDLKMGGKRVEQILAFPALCKLVVLCGSAVLFYSLPELRPVPSNLMPSIKG